MKPIIIVGTCWRNEIAVDAQRATWAKENCGIDIKFFFGKGTTRSPKSDEVFLDVPDDYKNHVLKIHGAYKWAKSNGYTHAYKTDDDVFLNPERLLNSGLFKYYYFGTYRPPVVDYEYGYMHGGVGYGVGPTALDLIVKATPDRKSEDGWVANILGSAGIKGVDDPRFVYKRRLYKDPLPTDMTEFYKKGIAVAEFAPQELFRVNRGWELANRKDT
jgi:hypothetical protein